MASGGEALGQGTAQPARRARQVGTGCEGQESSGWPLRAAHTFCCHPPVVLFTGS